MKIFYLPIGFTLYIVVMYYVSTYLYESLERFEQNKGQYKRGLIFVPGGNIYNRREENKPVVDFANFYKEAVKNLIPKLTPEEQRELTKWSNEKQIISRAKNCDTYFKTFSPIMFDGTIKDFEKTTLKPFNLAFVHNVKKDVAIYEAFLSIYFRPNNFYCIHLDKKAEDEVREALELMITCYSKKLNKGQIIILEQNASYEVAWGGDALVRADVDCLKELLNIKKDPKRSWKYVSIMSGDELPLVTYAQYHQEIAQKLKDDQSAVESVPAPNMQILDRLMVKQRADCTNCPPEIKTQQYNSSWKPLVAKKPLQFFVFHDLNLDGKPSIQIYKGIRNVILCVKDAEFIVNDKIANSFMRWQIGGQFTEEHFYSTLIRIGRDYSENSISQDTSTKNEQFLHNICPRYTPWYFGPRAGVKNNKKKACFGKYELGVCNFNIFDLSTLYDPSNTCLTATRFSLETDSSAVLIHLMNLMGRSFVETNTATKKMKDYPQGPEQHFVHHFYENMHSFLIN